MKDHIQEKIDVYDLEMRVEDVTPYLLSLLPEHAVDARLESTWSVYDGDREYQLVCYRPMTEKELERAKRDRKLAREATARRKREQEERERKEYDRLRKKFEGKK